MQFNSERHLLLSDIAHQNCIGEDRFSKFVDTVILAGVPIQQIVMPAWPKVPYSNIAGWIIFGGGWWKGKFWEGQQSIIDIEHETVVQKIADTVRGDSMSQENIAYVWDVEVYNSNKHILLRSWLTKHNLDIVEFFREYLPKLRSETDRKDLIVEVSNPSVKKESEQGSYSPTRRAVRRRDADLVLHGFASRTKPIEDNFNQRVSWVRAEDDSRWEARANMEPQSSEWSQHTSWIQRPLNSGARREDDINEETGMYRGPFMELFDDGMLWVWASNRVSKRLIDETIIINGIHVKLEPESTGGICRMRGQLDDAQISAVLGGLLRRVKEVPEEPTANDGQRLKDQPENVQASFRATWGELAEERWVQEHNVSLSKSEKTIIEEAQSIIDIDESKEKVQTHGSRVPKPPPPPTPVVVHETIDPGAGGKVFSPSAVRKAISEVIGPFHYFGQSVSDSGIYAMTRVGLDQFLLEDKTDRLTYIRDLGNRNFDCENFAETLRNRLVRLHGINSCAVLWGDAHAWNLFIIVNDEEEPEIVMVEPQDDSIVKKLSGVYSIKKRSEVLL